MNRREGERRGRRRERGDGDIWSEEILKNMRRRRKGNERKGMREEGKGKERKDGELPSETPKICLTYFGGKL